MTGSRPPDFAIGPDDSERIHDDSRLLEIVGPPSSQRQEDPGSISSDEAHEAGAAGSVQDQRDGTGTLVSSLGANTNDYEGTTATRDYMGMRQLNFTSVGLCGRDQEQQVLREVYQRVSNQNPAGKSEVCLVHGVSGIGKSALVETLRRVVTATAGSVDEDGSTGVSQSSMKHPIQDSVAEGYFVEGKFEQMRQASPYSALNAALTDLCDLILQSQGMSRIQARIRRNLQSADIKTLSYLVPNLGQVMGETATPQDQGIDDKVAEAAMARRNQEPVESGKAFTAFKVLVRRFLSAVASPTNPLVVFLDDVQWADTASMGIIETLTRDKDLPCMLLVLSYRDNDVSLIGPIEALKSSSAINVTEMHITELDSDDVNDMLSSLLQRHPLEMRSLAELIIHKTSGNPHHVVQFLKVLRSKELLSYSYDDEAWTWDEDQIRAQTNVATNVVELVKEGIGRLNQVTRFVLMFASCLGFNFDVEILWRIVENQRLLEHFPDPPALFIEAIKDGEREGLIEKGLRVRGDEVGWLSEQGVRQEYKFTHDDVQECLYYYFPDANDRDLLHGRIGELLQQLSFASESEEVRDSLQFEATNQCNQAAGQCTTYVEKVDLARMNTFTAGIAVKQSAFDGAANYYRTALQYLDQDRIWQTDYDLIFEILSSLSRMEFILGRFEECREIVDEVLERANSLEDQIKMLRTQIESLGVQGNLTEARILGFETLEHLGEKFPKNPTTAHVMLTFIRLSSLLRNKSDNDLLSLVSMEQNDPKLLALKILRPLVLYSYFSEEIEYMALGVMRMVELTVKHGNSVMSPFAYGMFAMVLSFLQRREQSYRFATLTLRLLRENPTLFREAQPGGLCAVYCFAAHWRRKLVENRKYLREAHKVGPVVGDYTFVAIGACAAFNAAFFVTTSYPDLYHEGRAYLSEMEAFGQETLRMLTIPYCQAVDNMVGECDDPVRLTGEIMQEKEFLEEAYKLKHKTTFAGTNFVRLIVTTVFCDWDLATKVIDKLEPHTKTHEGHFNVCYYDFSRGLVWAGAYQREKDRGVWRKFVSIVKKLELLSKKGVKACTPLYLFLKAEEHSGRNNVAEARRTFDQAIAACSDSSYCLYEGLANERCGEMLLAKKHYAAEHYLTRAVYIYNEIGAISKTHQVERNHPSIFKTDSGRESFNFVNRNAYVFAESMDEGLGSDEASTLGEYTRKPSTTSTASTVSVSSETFSGRNSASGPVIPESPEVRLHGRSQESDVLYGAFKGLCTVPSKDTIRCCLIHGPEGVGKTSLVAGLQQKMGGGALVSGKFDKFNQVSRPFAALRQALSALCQYLGKNNSSTVRGDIAKELSHESPTLTAFMPEMKALFPEGCHSCDESSIGIISLKRLIDALRSLMRMVATPSLPVIFFLDDLHWADEDSLTIFEALIEDSETRHVLYIGAYRDEGKDRRVSLLSEQGKPWLKGIRLENLSLDAVNEIISCTVDREASEIGDLGKLVHSKSQGNPCYTSMFVSYLVAHNLLRLEPGSSKRTWDCDEITIRTRWFNSTTSLLEAKIDRLDGRDVLLLASLLGYEFEIPLLEQILEGNSVDNFMRNPGSASVPSAVGPRGPATEGPTNLKKVIDEAVAQHILERVGHQRCRFTGNKVQEVLLWMAGSETQRSKIHFEIGKILFRTDKADKSTVFDACNHLTLGQTNLKTPEDLFELARVNVEAAKLAVAAVGYGWALSRIKLAQLSVDREKKWARDYDFSLEFCNLVASVEFAFGNHVSCRLVVDEVASHARNANVGGVSTNVRSASVDGDSMHERSPVDRVITSVMQLKSFHAKGEFVEAQEYALEVLGDLGFPLKNPTTFNVWMDLVSTRWLVNPKTGVDGAAMSRVSDEAPGENAAAMEVLASLVENSFLVESSEIFALASMQMLRLSVKHGISKYTPLALACYGAIVITTLGDVQGGYRYGEQALSLCRQFRDPAYSARTHFVVNLYLKHWREPVMGCALALHDAYKEGKGSCDLAFSSLSGEGHALLLLFAGTELKQVSTTLTTYIHEFRYYKQPVALLMIQPFLQLTHCLMGEAEDPKKLEGTALNQEQFLANGAAEMESFAIPGVNAAQLMLSCFLGEVESASNAMTKLREFDKTPLAHFVHAQISFFSTWTKLQLAKREGQAKTTLVEARKNLKKFERWSADGAVNLKALTILLQAEYAALNGDNEKAKTLFDSAAKAAEDTKLVHYQAFSFELAGRHLLNAMDDETQATYYLSMARTLWGAYGATAKVQQLDETYQSMFVSK